MNKRTYYSNALNEIGNRLENRLPIFGYNNSIKIDEDNELYLFDHGATYSAEIWDNSTGEIAETVAEALVMGTGDFDDDIYYLIDRVFEDWD
jgi:hypothetical protein